MSKVPTKTFEGLEMRTTGDSKDASVHNIESLVLPLIKPFYQKPIENANRPVAIGSSTWNE